MTQQSHARCCTCLLSCVRLLASPMDHSLPGTSVHGDSPGKNTGVGYHFLFQGIFPTQGSNPCLPHSRQILYHLRHQGSPWILEGEACAFFRVSSWPRNRTRVSCIAGSYFTSWATREPPSRYPHEKCICSQKDLYKNIYRSFIQNGPDWKKSSTGEWIDKL